MYGRPPHRFMRCCISSQQPSGSSNRDGLAVVLKDVIQLLRIGRRG